MGLSFDALIPPTFGITISITSELTSLESGGTSHLWSGIPSDSLGIRIRFSTPNFMNSSASVTGMVSRCSSPILRELSGSSVDRTGSSGVIASPTTCRRGKKKIMHSVIFLPGSVPSCGHIKNSLSDRLYGVYAPITDPQKLWSALEFKYKQHKEGTNRYLISKFFDFQLVDEKPILEQVHELQILVNKLNVLSIPIPEMLQHLRIEEEARNRDKRVTHGSTVHHVQVENSSKRGSRNGPTKFNLGVNRDKFKKTGPSKRTGKCHVCGNTGHYARKCKLRKSGNDDVNLVNGEITDRVAHVYLDDDNFMA
nr:copia-like retrotransposon [Tanacetum cinerariifolium]